jgi:F-type H+-transporting ATPase subunit gamma
MQTLAVLKKRLKATASLKDIVKSMKTLSAVSVGQYEKSAEALGQYANNIELAIMAVLGSGPIPDSAPAAVGAKTVAVVLGSDQGLVGRFNKSVMDFAFEFLEREKIARADAAIVVGGRSLAAKITAAGRDVDTLFTMPGSVRVVSTVAKKIILRLNELACDGASAHIFYNRKTASGPKPEHLRLLPVDSGFFGRLKSRRWPSRGLPVYAAPPAGLMDGFMRQLLFVGVYRAISNSLAAEHFARMMAMQGAEDNIDGRLSEIRLEYQTRRQDEITSELVDIVVGAGASAPSGL